MKAPGMLGITHPIPWGLGCLAFLGSKSLPWLGRLGSPSRERQEMTVADVMR